MFRLNTITFSLSYTGVVKSGNLILELREFPISMRSVFSKNNRIKTKEIFLTTAILLLFHSEISLI